MFPYRVQMVAMQAKIIIINTFSSLVIGFYSTNSDFSYKEAILLKRSEADLALSTTD